MINPKKLKIIRNMACSPIYFGQVIAPDMFKVKSPDFHYMIEKAVLNFDDDALNIAAPRGHAKSSLAACIVPMWHIFMEDYYRFLTQQLTEDPLDRNLIPMFKAFEQGKLRYLPFRPKVVELISKTQAEAILRLETIKGVLGDPELGNPSRILKQIVGDVSYNTASKWTTKEVTLFDSSYLFSIGTGQQARGKKKGHQRPTLAVIDDPEDEENTKTAERMRQNMDWLMQAIIPGLDVYRGRAICIGTPQNEGSMVVTLSRSERWKNLWFSNDLASGDLLWPWYITEDRLRKEYLDNKSRGRVSSYYREWECKIVGDEDQLFKQDQMQYWEGEVEWDDDNEPYLAIKAISKSNAEGELSRLTYLEPVKKAINIQVGVDPASSTEMDADFTVIMVIGIDENKNRYCLDMWRRRAKPSTVAAKMIEIFKRWKPHRAYVETVGYQEMLREGVQDRMESEGIFIVGLNKKNNPRMAKSARLEGLEYEFLSKKVFFHMKGLTESGKPDTIFQPFIDELLLYPLAKKRDCPDAYWYARKRVIPPNREIVLEKKQEAVELPFIDWRTA